MSSTTFASLVEIEPTMSKFQDEQPGVVPPQKAHAKTYHSIPSPRQDDVDNLQWGAKLNGPSVEEPSSPTAQRDHDLEMSRPGTPAEGDADGDGFGVVQSFSNPPMNRYRMITVCLLNFAGGFNDSAPGALIPYMEKYVLLLSSLYNILMILQILSHRLCRRIAYLRHERHRLRLRCFCSRHATRSIRTCQNHDYCSVLHVGGIHDVECDTSLSGCCSCFLHVGLWHGVESGVG